MTDGTLDIAARSSTSAPAPRPHGLPRRGRRGPAPRLRLISRRLRQRVKTDRLAMATGAGMTGLLALLLTLALLPTPFGIVHALVAGATLQLIAALHLTLSALDPRATLGLGPLAAGEQERLADLAWSLNEREARLRALLDGQDSVIVSRDEAGRVTFVNRAFCRMFGSDGSALVGRPLALAAIGLGNARDTTGAQVCEVSTADGPRWIEWYEHRVVSTAGHYEIQAIGRDVTGERAATAALSTARDEARAADLAKSRFLAAMSHEIRTPMSGILGMAGLLLGTEQTAEQRTYAAAIDRSARTLVALIGEILDFSKIEAGRLTLEQAPFALDDCVGSAVELLAPRAHEKGLEIAWLIDHDVPLAVCGDEHRVRQILLNLIGNAVKFTERGGVLVRVAAGPSASPRDAAAGLVIEIVDTGVGIATGDLPRLFKDFGQVERTSGHRKGGTGLGLAISRRLARAMGGDIMVESRPGHGSTFRVALTLQRAVAHATPPVERPAVAAPRRVLLAFDRRIERGAAAAILAGEGIAVIEADLADAQAAVRDAVGRAQPCDVIVVDAAIGLAAAEAVVAAARASNAGRALDAMLLVDAATRPAQGELTAHGFAGWAVRPLRPRALARLVTRGVSDDPPALSPKPAPPRLALPNGRALRVLLAEDDDVNALLGTSILRKAGCFATVVRTGREAVEAVQAGLAAGEPDFDIVLMDIVMPELGGVEATTAIHKLYAARIDGPRIAPPIVALTANAFVEDRQRYLAAGLDDYLSKPFDGADLQALLRRWATRLKATVAA